MMPREFRMIYHGIVGPWEAYDLEVVVWSCRHWAERGVTFTVEFRNIQ